MKPLNQWNFADVLALVKGIDKRTWIVIGASVAGALLLLVFFVIPAWIERPLLRRDIQSMESQIRQVNALNQKRLVWEEDQKVFEALIQKTQDRLFTPESLALLLGQVSKKAGDSRVDVLASKPMTEALVFPAPYHLKYQPSGYEFTVQGGYHELARMVSRIEGHEKLMRIQSIQIVPSGKSPDRHISQLRLWAILNATPASPGGAKDAKK
ncbi:MAG TPA: hypothetical protein P5561_05605 [Candidatus Omnitrophota bacterium]|nr:hypothetical protein [Candidatus Omnitrophota bacterium]HRY85986.1 hypothetical protein [Candidatus Omnitrophota bacterium]